MLDVTVTLTEEEARRLYWAADWAGDNHPLGDTTAAQLRSARDKIFAAAHPPRPAAACAGCAFFVGSRVRIIGWPGTIVHLRDDEPTASGWCHRYAPSTGSAEAHRWPRVWANDSCGEFRAKEGRL